MGKTPLYEKPTAGFRRLTADDALLVLQHSTELLKRHLSIGGEESSLGLPHRTLKRLEFVNNELLLLNNAVNSE
jgi:hypothetical protein